MHGANLPSFVSIVTREYDPDVFTSVADITCCSPN